MEELEADLVVIGSGPAGQKAAIQSAKFGKRVIVVEQLPDPGGSCLFSGTIPSKTLREAIIDMTRFFERHFSKETYERGKVSIAQLNNRLKRVIDEEKSMLYRQLRRNNVYLLHGLAVFNNPYEMVVTDDRYQIQYMIRPKSFIIATGSKPRHPKNVDFDGKYILDSTTLLQIDTIPESMIVLGGGIIGSEYGSFFAALGSAITIVDKKDHILPLLDTEIGIHLQTSLTDIGLKFIGNSSPKEIKRDEKGVEVTFEGSGSIRADALLYALGRIANVDNLQIEKTGVMLNEKGYIPVNSLFQTCVPHIYAVGDVIGGPSLASTSMEQGRLAARHVCGAQTHHFPSTYPIGIYTIPEISSCGYTEAQLKELGFRYEVGRAYYYEIARSHIVGSDTGMFKILFHSETLEILGVHVIGRGATEVIHIGQMAMNFHAKLDHFVDLIFNYPTYAEGYRVAALNGLNKIHRRI